MDLGAYKARSLLEQLRLPSSSAVQGLLTVPHSQTATRRMYSSLLNRKNLKMVQLRKLRMAQPDFPFNLAPDRLANASTDPSGSHACRGFPSR